MSEYEPASDDYGQEPNDGGQGDYGQPEPGYDQGSGYGQEPHSIEALFTDGTSVEATDYNHDGVADLLSYDEDGDGTTDGVFVDTDGDGLLDSQFVPYGGEGGGEYSEPAYAGAEHSGDGGGEPTDAGPQYGGSGEYQDSGQYGDQGQHGTSGYDGAEPGDTGDGETGRSDTGQADAGEAASQGGQLRG